MEISSTAEDPVASAITGSLGVLLLRFAFTQDQLLKSDEFIKVAEERGHRLDRGDLERLHRAGLLVPFYRASDTAVAGRRLRIEPDGNLNARRVAQMAAASGRLRDCVEEGYSAAWSYSRPEGETDRRWWNGFLFSSWQLTGVDQALKDDGWLRLGRPLADLQLRAQTRRRLAVALAALAPRYLPGILGRLSVPPGMDSHALRSLELEPDPLGRLAVAGVQSDDLRQMAEELLLHAGFRDPLQDWLPIVRHANFSAWSKLRGAALDCLWQRVAAEVLLRAHDDLATVGAVEPLPDLAQRVLHHPLHDRLGRRGADADSLDESLGRFGLSPYPRVLLLVEGETELDHLPRLLAAFGLDRPDLVRVQHAKGSDVSPQLLARYAITPRLGRHYPDGSRQMVATPTALVIAMDPENRWETAELRERERSSIYGAIREEVKFQGGTIPDDHLEVLVNIHVWGEHRYELANFTDRELVDVLATLARGKMDTDRGSPAWRQRVHAELAHARADRRDIKVVIGKMRLSKTTFAAALAPLLLKKCEQELEANIIITPVLKVVLEVERLVNLLSGGTYVLPRATTLEHETAWPV